MNEIRIIRKEWDKVSAHLHSSRPPNSSERFAFFLAETTRLSDGSVLFLATDSILIDDKDVDLKGYHAEIKTEKIIEVINTAVREKKALIEVHNHYSLRKFSDTDQEGFREFVPYVLESLKNSPYAAIVVTNDNVADALFWLNKENLHGIAIDEIRLFSEQIEKLHLSRNPAQNMLSELGRYKRQIMVFGEEGQRRISTMKVAVVGLGGLGSHVAQQLAYLGVRNFVLIDLDLVDDTNLNRLIGAYPTNVKEAKVEVAKRQIDLITANRASVRTIQRDLRTDEALDALEQVDVIFGCVDNDGPRVVLTDLALAYLVHIIDCAAGVVTPTEEGLEANGNCEIEAAGGRVVVLSPGGPCLNCAHEIDQKEARDYLSSEEERKINRGLGYVKDVDSPSVVSLNGVIASLAVTEFMMLVTGLRTPAFFTIYDLLSNNGASVTHRTVPIDPDCLHHSKLGIGDKILLQRYLIPLSSKVSA